MPRMFLDRTCALVLKVRRSELVVMLVAERKLKRGVYGGVLFLRVPILVPSQA